VKEIVADRALVAYCGLYCGACGKYLRGDCTGCGHNEDASWCKVRRCCHEAEIESCAGCKTCDDVRACPKFNNWISRTIGFFLRSDRAACIAAIKELGYEGFAEKMAKEKRQSIRRR